MDHIQKLLSNLTNAKEDLAKSAAPFEATIDTAIAARDRHCSRLDAKIKMLEAELRHETLLHGKTVKGTRIWAVYNRGRISWNNQGLTGYSVAHPEILTFRKRGNPYVSIREAKIKDHRAEP